MWQQMWQLRKNKKLWDKIWVVTRVVQNYMGEFWSQKMGNKLEIHYLENDADEEIFALVFRFKINWWEYSKINLYKDVHRLQVIRPSPIYSKFVVCKHRRQTATSTYIRCKKSFFCRMLENDSSWWLREVILRCKNDGSLSVFYFLYELNSSTHRL